MNDRNSIWIIKYEHKQTNAFTAFSFNKYSNSLSLWTDLQIRWFNTPSQHLQIKELNTVMISDK